MISPHHNKPPAGKDDPITSSGRRTAALSRPPQDPPPKCPRCDSPNTKFCYYNNYSLAQPRHFCKTCRRYWTNGGALRNVPIGGGCRKTKKIKTSSGEPSGLKFFQGVSPAMDFQLNFPRISPPAAALFNPFSAFENLSSACGAISSMDNPSPSFGFGYQEMGQSSNLASSIESLSCINQDLHWKLQRQRLSMLQFSGDDNNNNNNQNLENDYNTPSYETLVQTQKPQPILFQNLDMSQNQDQDLSCADIGGNNNNNNSLSTEWFFDNPYATVNPTPATSGTNPNGGDSSNWNIGVQDLY